LLAGAFFPAHYAGTVVFGIILLGLAVSALSALLLGKLVFRGESSPFVMELPPYRMPTLKGLGLRTWERAWVFLRKVSSVILIGVTLIWFLGAFPMGSEPFSADTLAGRLGRFVEPAFRPLGMEWRAVVALGFGVVAKEIVVSSLGVLYSGQAGETSDAEVFELNLQQRLRDNWTRMQAISFIIFALLYIPCLGTVGAMLREIGWRWTLFAVGYELFVAYALAAAVYATGTALGF